MGVHDAGLRDFRDSDQDVGQAGSIGRQNGVEIPLSTQRLILSKPVPPDAPFLDSLMGNEEVRRFLGGPIPPDRREAIIPSCFAEGDAHLVLWIVETKPPLHPIGIAVQSLASRRL